MYGQVVLGPPGSGKTTYCNGMSQYLTSLGRPVAIINLDPANDSLPYDCAISICELITLEDIQTELNLGPNGAFIYALEFLLENIDWLLNKIQKLDPSSYLLFDFPGQVELFTVHTIVPDILNHIVKRGDVRLAAVHLVDAHHASDPSKFISVTLLSLSIMLQLELPHVNVLSKVDLVESCGSLSYKLDFYTRCTDLRRLVDGGTGGSTSTDDKDRDKKHPTLSHKFQSLNAAICDLVEDYGLVSFTLLNIEDKETVAHLAQTIDKANGFVLRNALTSQSYFGGAQTEDLFESELIDRYQSILYDPI